MAGDFSIDQKRYLEGFVAGAQALRSVQGGGAAAPPSTDHEGPDKAHLEAQDKATASGGKLSDAEKWKRAENPLDAYARLRREAKAGRYPKPDDNFRWRYHGLFYVAPTQDSYMCRLRIPNGILKHWQFTGVADLAERYGGGYSHATTRANLQIREIKAEAAPDLIEDLAALGLVAKGAGADNIRNVTGDATAGVDPQALIDTRPLAAAWHNHILNNRSLYGLPRKFNVAFDGGGSVPTLEETNDIGFQAVVVGEGAAFEGQRVAAGVWLRLMLGGITGHKDLARDAGVILRPEEANEVADAVLRVFIEHGDRTNRARARLKYLLDAWGFARFIEALEEKLGRKTVRIDPAFVAPRPATDRFAHIGRHKQKQPGLNWIGVSLPVGKMTADEMRALSSIARDCGDGDIRLTVWQNLLLSGVADANVPAAIAGIERCGLSADASFLRAGLVACTGNRGCKFALADTKADAMAIADHVEARVTLDSPINIHLTGCPNSCAQHYIGDIGLVGVKVDISEDEQEPGYNIVVGGGFGADPKIGRELLPGVKATEAPRLIEQALKAYRAHRRSVEEDFQAFANRHEIEALKAILLQADP